jgi:hypothetical protein
VALGRMLVGNTAYAEERDRRRCENARTRDA